MIVGFSSAVAGAGATTLLLAAARRLAVRGAKVVVVDGDPRAELSRRLEVRPTRPLCDLFGASAADARALVPIPKGEIRVLPADAGRFIVGGVTCTAEVAHATIEAAKGGADVVLVDLPAVDTPPWPILTALLDRVIAVVPAHQAGVRAMPGLLRAILGSRAGEDRPVLAAIAITAHRDEATVNHLVEACARVRPIVLRYETAFAEEALPRPQTNARAIDDLVIAVAPDRASTATVPMPSAKAAS